nr:MAG TPA: Major tail protein [Caudoviricetes sp.]
MATIILYDDCKLIQGKNYLIDSEQALQGYLNSLDSTTITDFQYQRIELDKVIKINFKQTYAEKGIGASGHYYNYCSINNGVGSRKYYYFIQNITQVSEYCEEFTLHMDVLNTFRIEDDYYFSNRTHINREHKDRFITSSVVIGEQETRIKRKIDFLSEGLQTQVYKLNETIINQKASLNEDDDTIENQDFYLCFYSYPKTETSEKNIEVYLFCENDSFVMYNKKYPTSAKTLHQWVSFKNRTMITDYRLENEIFAIKIPYRINGIDYDSSLKRFTINNSGSNYIIIENNVMTCKEITGSQTPLIYFSYIFGASGYTLPFNLKAYTSDMFIELMTYIPFIKGQAKNEFLLSTKQLALESKLFHSDYYYHKLSYDTESIIVELQKMKNDEFDSMNDAPSISGRVSNSLNSIIAFKLDDYISEESSFTEDYQNILISNRNNQMTLISDSYIEYLRNGYNYDKKINEMGSASDIKNLIINGLTAGAGIALAPATGGISAIGAIQGGAGFVNSIINIAENQERRNLALENKITQLKNQTLNVQGGSNIDIMEFYSHNRLIDFSYQIQDVTKRVLWELFYFCGYTSNRYAIPNLNTRARFNFIQCDAVFDYIYNIPNEMLDELIIMYSQGVTALHYVDTYENLFNFELENWENSLISVLYK